MGCKQHRLINASKLIDSEVPSMEDISVKLSPHPPAYPPHPTHPPHHIKTVNLDAASAAHHHPHHHHHHHHHQDPEPDETFLKDHPQADHIPDLASHGEGGVYHSHDGLAPHYHEPLESPGVFVQRAPPLSGRDFSERAFTVGIGGPVGTGKTALMLAICRQLRDSHSLAAVTNDIFTREDGEFLVRNGALAPERIRAVETGGCPHAAIREDISINLGPLEELSQKFQADIVLCESGGDNLAANFSRELADYIIYIIDVAGGDKIPRKGGPGITQADLLVINKTDLAQAVGADLAVMERDSLAMREGGPFVFAQVKNGVGTVEIVNHILAAWKQATGDGQRSS